MITSIAHFTMKAGKEDLALKRLAAVRAQAEREQPGVVFYLVHRVLDKKSMRPTRKLMFYESYVDESALNRHLKSKEWQAVVKGWSDCFEGTSDVSFVSLERIAGFVHLQAP